MFGSWDLLFSKSLLSGLMHEHQHLSGADYRVVADLVAIEHGLSARIDVEALAEARPDLRDSAVAERQPLHVRADGHRDEATRFMVIVEEAAETAGVGGPFPGCWLSQFSHGSLGVLKFMRQQVGLRHATERCHADSVGHIDILARVHL